MLILSDQGSFNFIRSLIFIDELARAGIKDVCISPGSRSTPLALAFYHHGDFNIHMIVDERSAAFFGLGIAKGSKLPVVLLCTSGTATANYFPAIIEADKTNIPLIIITADRPPKLRNTGVNQMIDQIELYGNKVRCFEDIIEPNIAEYNKSKIREYTDYLRNTACKVINYSTKIYQNGPVHINFPFSKPLEPQNQDLIGDLKKLHMEDDLFKGKKDNLPFLSNSFQESEFNKSNLENLIKLIGKAKRIIVIGGGQEDGEELPKKIIELAVSLKIPIIADVLSGLRFTSKQDSNIITCINQLISSDLITTIQDPDLILQFGRNPISTSIELFLNSLEKSPKIHITGNIKWNDPIRVLDQNLQFDPVECIDYIITNKSEVNQDLNWTNSLIELNKKTIKLVEENLNKGLEANLINQIIKEIKQETNLFLSNSLPIRYVDEFVYSSNIKIHIYGNRGASGIDGIISTAAGVAYGTGKPTLLIIGDLALFHDIQGLLLTQKQSIKLSILVINNSGGGIFRRLPIAKYDLIYEELFNTSIALDIEKFSILFEMGYKLISSSLDDVTDINSNITSQENQIFEYKTNSIDFENFRKDLDNRIRESLR